MELHHLHWSGLPFVGFNLFSEELDHEDPWSGSVTFKFAQRERRLKDPTKWCFKQLCIYIYILYTVIQWYIVYLYYFPIYSTIFHTIPPFHHKLGARHMSLPGSISPVVAATLVQPTAGEHRYHARHGAHFTHFHMMCVCFLLSILHKKTNVKADGAADFAHFWA
jgi:hypothetical protein